MQKLLNINLIAMFLFGSCAFGGDTTPLLRRVQTIVLDGVEGRMDHLALDATGQTLFLAALGNNTLEVIDLQAGKRTRQVEGMKEPQGVVLIPESDLLAVASGEDGKCRFYDRSLNIVATVDGLEDADNARYDRERKQVYVAYGNGGLAVVDATNQKKIGDIPLAGHPESFQLETSGPRIFVNVPSAHHVAVVDRRTRSVIMTWAIAEAAKNYPMALDEANHRLFIGYREPAKLLVMDTESGKVIASLDCCGDADDIFYDTALQRIYVSGGEGCISIFQQAGPDMYAELGRVATAPGARTALFVPETRTLYLAVPHRDNQAAAIWVYGSESGSP